MASGSHRQGAHRHLMIVHNHWPDPRVEREARALVADGIQVDVLCARDPYNSPDSQFPGIEVQRLPVWRRRGRGPALQMLEYVAFLCAGHVSRHRPPRSSPLPDGPGPHPA